MVQIFIVRKYTPIRDLKRHNTDNGQDLKLHDSTIFLGMCKVHLLQVDIRSNYYACHAGMRNRKMTRNVCITLGQMFPLRVEEPPRKIRWTSRAFSCSRGSVRSSSATCIHGASTARSEHLFFLTVRVSTRLVY